MRATLGLVLCYLATVSESTLAKPIVYDGRARFNLTDADLDGSIGPFLTVVKGSRNASHYTHLLGHTVPATPLWDASVEQALSVTIDNSSVFVPGGAGPQLGFRRTDLIAARDGEHDGLVARMEQNTTVFHFSVRADERRPLNLSHEYQIVFVEPADGSHVFGIQLGSPFTNPTGPLPAPDAHAFKVLDHALNVLFAAPFAPRRRAWHNFGVEVDWAGRTLAVLYSRDAAPLARVTGVVANPTAGAGAEGRGDLHFGVLKLPLVDPADSLADQGDVVHHGMQEGTTEGLLYSGVFVESVVGGVSRGGDGRSP